MGNSLYDSFFFMPYTYTHEEWSDRYLNAIETLSSLSKIDYQKKIYFNEKDGKFYNSNWKIAENLKGWIGSWAAYYLGSCEEALYRKLWKLSISDTIDGIERAKFRIKGTLAIAQRILEGKAQHPTLKISDLETQMVDLQRNLKKASEELNHLPAAYHSSLRKRTTLKPVINDFCTDLEKFAYEVIAQINEKKIKYAVPQKSPFSLIGNPKLPLPLEPSPLDSPEQQCSRSSTDDFKASSQEEVGLPTEPVPLPAKIVGDPNLPSAFPYPGQNQAQLKFNESLANQFSRMKVYLENNQERLVQEMEASGQEYYRFKSKTDEIPWSIAITKEKELYFHLHSTIVPKGQGGAQKSDKRAYDPIKKENIAKLSTKCHPRQKRKIQFAKREEEFLKAFSKKNLPNVVKVYDVFWVAIKGFLKQIIYMKHYIHGDLKSNLERLGQDGEKNKKILFGIINGLAAIHREGIVHRDLKPGNVLLDENDVPYISDFGCSTRKGETVSTDGSPVYMAPEITKHFEVENPMALYIQEPALFQASFETDVWSYGMLMYGLLVNPTEKIPWPWLKKAKQETLYKMTINEKEKLFPEPKKEDVWLHLCWECLQIDPSKRPTAQEIREQLAPFFVMAKNG